MFGTVLSDDAQTALAVLGKSRLLKDAYLAGGSALAVHYGHRYSLDFDFFSPTVFDPLALSVSLSKVGEFVETVAKGISLIGTFNGITFSYFQYDYPMIEPQVPFSHVLLAHPHDIAAMKVVAIMDRGTKRDFVDVYEMHLQGISLERVLDLYEKKYHVFANNTFSVVKAFGYFDDAEEGVMPKMIRKVTWEEIKKFFTSESLRLAKKYL